MIEITQATPITDYKMLTPLPNTLGSGGAPINDLTGYIPNLFNIIIGLAAVLAVGWIIWGGIEYITTDSWQNKQEGKRRIFNAIWGLLIVIGAWLILYTINPRLLSFDLNIAATPVTAPGAATGGIFVNPCSDPTAVSCATEKEAEAQFTSVANPKIAINNTCTASGCPTQVGGFQQVTTNGILSLDTQCNCSLMITGGSEPMGHSVGSDHYVGLAVDLQSNGGSNTSLNQIITGSSANPPPNWNNNGQTVTIGGQQAHVCYEPPGATCGGTQPSTGTTPHWHISFK